jgi:hypothetical protein
MLFLKLLKSISKVGYNFSITSFAFSLFSPWRSFSNLVNQLSFLTNSSNSSSSLISYIFLKASFIGALDPHSEIADPLPFNSNTSFPITISPCPDFPGIFLEFGINVTNASSPAPNWLEVVWINFFIKLLGKLEEENKVSKLPSFSNETFLLDSI